MFGSIGSKAANRRLPPDCRMIEEKALREVLYGGLLAAVARVKPARRNHLHTQRRHDLPYQLECH